jgi:hypothetical protein
MHYGQLTGQALIIVTGQTWYRNLVTALKYLAVFRQSDRFSRSAAAAGHDPYDSFRKLRSTVGRIPPLR